jgi:SAM-dependent methyltransferase
MDDSSSPGWMAENRASWDELAAIHLRDATGFYAVERFRSGQDILYDLVVAEIGEVRGRRLAHLQCHIGIDALCLARRGAVVTGLDYSAPAVAGAQSLAAETGLAATFVCADVYDAPRALAGPFDIVYVSWGSLNWLPDMRRWGEVIGALLAPGGYLYLVEQHPFVAVIKEINGWLHPYYSWRTPPARPIVTEAPTAYSGDQTRREHSRQHEWDHPLSDVIGALMAAGLHIDFFREHEVLPWRRLSMMVPGTDRMFRMPDHEVRMPLSFSLKASKP